MKVGSLDIRFTQNKEMELLVIITNHNQYINKIEETRKLILEGKEFELELKEVKKRRSLDANAYCWILSDKIAQAIGNTKEFVYKQAIKQVGQFEIVPIKKDIDIMARWITAWESKGIGWQSYVMRDSKVEGYVNTMNYFGSSVYNTKEMSLLLEEIVFQAKELDIDTLSDAERLKLINSYKGE